jgi:hypothetical protein
VRQVSTLAEMTATSKTEKACIAGGESDPDDNENRVKPFD